MDQSDHFTDLRTSVYDGPSTLVKVKCHIFQTVRNEESLTLRGGEVKSEVI